MSQSVLIVGCGLAGLTTALMARDRGHRVRLLAEGRGSLSLTHGCIDVWKDGHLPAALETLSAHHPLKRIGAESLIASLEAFLGFTGAADLPYHLPPGRNLRLPSPTGSVHHTAAAPFSLANGSLDTPGVLHLAHIPEIGDFEPALVASGLRRRGYAEVALIELPLPESVRGDRAEPLRIASRLDQAEARQALCRAWSPRLRDVRRLGLPAILGLDASVEAVADVEARLGVTLFEIPTLPPNLPGIRLERALRRLAQAAGVDFVEGASARGEVDGRSQGRRVSGVVAATAAGPRRFPADIVVLATGGALAGGWLGFTSGEVQESVFGLPLEAPSERQQWVREDPYSAQPYARFGLQVDARQRPVDARGRLYFENLYAVGGILGGADRTREGSRQGIDIASAYVAAREIPT